MPTYDAREDGTLQRVVDDWGTMATGKSGWLEIEKAWLRKVQECYGVFCSKQQDYGPTNIGVGGLHGLTVRMGDKVSRLFELLGLTKRKSDGAPANESIRDSFMDFADYGLIGLTVFDGDWPVVEPNQVWGQEALYDLVLDLAKDDLDFKTELINHLLSLGLAEEIAGDIGGEVKIVAKTL